MEEGTVRSSRGHKQEIICSVGWQSRGRLARQTWGTRGRKSARAQGLLTRGDRLCICACGEVSKPAVIRIPCRSRASLLQGFESVHSLLRSLFISQHARRIMRCAVVRVTLRLHCCCCSKRANHRCRDRFAHGSRQREERTDLAESRYSVSCALR